MRCKDCPEVGGDRLVCCVEGLYAAHDRAALAASGIDGALASAELHRERPTMPLADEKPAKPPETVPDGYRSETFDADEGTIKITWPSTLSPQSVEDMKDWLELLKRRIARRASDGAA